tara:strand:+ start:1303 stop:1506 length:204 start_codon:yes stop_codon:yes gene_type:complete
MSYRISEQEIRDLFNARKIDIQTRGENCYVYDKNNEIITLKKCSVWYDDKGKYVYPKATQELQCIIM